MKTIIMATLVAFMTMAAQAAIVITEETESAFNEAMTNPVAWHTQFSGGDAAGSGSLHEIYLSANVVKYGDTDWNFPSATQVTVSNDASGNIYSSAKSTTLDVQPTIPFTQIWIRLDDSGIFDTHLENILVNTVPSEGGVVNEGVRYWKILLDEPDQIFSLTADFSIGGGGFESTADIYGINSVPEPSIFLLLVAPALLCLRRVRSS